MARRREPVFVIFGAEPGRKTKMVIGGKSKRIGGYEILVYEYDEAADERTGMYLSLGFCSLKNLREFRDFVDEVTEKCEAEALEKIQI